MKLRFLPTIVPFLGFFYLFLFIQSPSLAQDKMGGVVLSPAFEEVVMTPDDTEKKVAIQLQNNDTKEVTFELFPINFRLVDDYGKIGFVGQDSKEYSFALSSFILLDDSTYTLRPKEKISIPVTIKNRQDLSPGGHYAAIVARVVQENKETVISPAVSSLILLRKTGGETYNLSIRDAGWPRGLFAFGYKSNFSVLFQNQGNVHLTPFGEIRVTDVLGRTLYKGVVNTSSLKIFPLSRRYIPVKLTRLNWSLPISINKISIKGHDSLDKVTYLHEDSFIYIHPLVMPILILVIIFHVAGFTKVRKFAPKRHKNEQFHTKTGK